MAEVRKLIPSRSTPLTSDNSNGTSERGWTFLSNHGHVLVYLSKDPQARMRDIAQAVGITERSTQAILTDLENAGYLEKTKVGRRNEYTIKLDQRFRHPTESHKSIGLLLEIFG